jgi:hypothetical protein
VAGSVKARSPEREAPAATDSSPPGLPADAPVPKIVKAIAATSAVRLRN